MVVYWFKNNGYIKDRNGYTVWYIKERIDT